ncbi:MAG: hypothetical protein PVH00_13320 [Gemmatimonadota bacterium]|jgi:hypothetical protein
MAEPSSRSIQWRRLVVESGAVILSILLAFSIDALWDRHQERIREDVLLRGILADYRASRPNLAERLELAGRLARNTALLRDLVSGWSGREPLTVPDSLILGVLGGPTYEPATNTLDAALGSGEIELIRSGEIKTELATWRRTLLDTTEDEVEVRRLTNEQLVPSLASAMDLGPYFARVLQWSSGEPVPGLPGHVTFTPPVDASSLLGLRHFFVQFSADDLAALLASLDRAIALLERETGMADAGSTNPPE